MSCGRPGHEHCAYTGAEPDLCPSCHRSWSVITTRDAESRYEHIQNHAVMATKRDKKVQQAAARAAQKAARATGGV